jgi:tetratricopeptide (TPR) repeat protein
MILKTIVSGSLEFGNQKTYDKVFNMFLHRVENYYKADLFVEFEECFVPEDFMLKIPRTVTESTNKIWKNSVDLLEYLAQFAFAGRIIAWTVESGKIINEVTVEPKCDKVAVQAYLRGREQLVEVGKEKEAISSFDKAIAKYSRHAYAYEKRGYVKLKLDDYAGAETDFKKSNSINPNIPEPYVGLGKIKMVSKDYSNALFDFTNAVKNSIPLMPIYWQAKRMKIQCHLELKQFNEAIGDLKLFCNRHFNEDDPNFKYNDWAWFNYGKVLLEIGDSQKALDVFNQSVENSDKEKSEIYSDFLVYRGIARKKNGKSGYKKDWTQAAKFGSEKANELLQVSE